MKNLQQTKNLMTVLMLLKRNKTLLVLKLLLNQPSPQMEKQYLQVQNAIKILLVRDQHAHLDTAAVELQRKKKEILQAIFWVELVLSSKFYQQEMISVIHQLHPCMKRLLMDPRNNTTSNALLELLNSLLLSFQLLLLPS